MKRHPVHRFYPTYRMKPYIYHGSTSKYMDMNYNNSINIFGIKLYIEYKWKDIN